MSKELWVAGTGLIGNKVAEYARSQEVGVVQTTRTKAEDKSGQSELLDITDYEAIKKYFWDHSFKKVIVAAGIALPSAADKNPERAFLVNAEGPRNIGRAVLTLPENRRPSVVFMGSALQYDVRQDGSVFEDTPFIKEGGAYVMSKIKMVDYIRELVRQGVDAKVAMIFNSTGPEQSTDYFFPSMADQAAKIHLGLQEPVIKSRYVGHVRDFSHVDDTAQGLFLSLRGKSGDLINVSSGYGVKLEDVIHILMEMSGVEGVTHEVDPQHSSPPKIHASWGDNSRLRGLGFIQQKDMVDICRDVFEERIKMNQK